VSRIFVTGAAGAVGSYVPEVFADDELVLTDLVGGDYDPLDVCEGQEVRAAVREAKPDVILHLAAATDVDRCEQDPNLAYRTNALGTENVALACREAGATLVYVSTAGVFPGDKPEPYTEFDEPDPANVYGRSKLAGERFVTSQLTNYYIVRAGWMIGGAHLDHKFVGKLTELIRSGRERLQAVDDKIGTPTFARDLLGGVQRLLAAGHVGLYHLTNDGFASRYEIALELRRILDRPDLVVEPVSSAYFPLPAPRARSEAMRNYKLELLGLQPMRPWQEALEEYVTQELLPLLAEGRSRAEGR
jgi:dTDP-4-dehydrorhamnose reductase